MRVLSLDTTTRDGSAAIVEDDRVVDVRQGDASRSHAERLPTELIALLDARGLTFADVDVFAVASGPGMFTGLRIGIATIQGLAFTSGKRVVAVSALEAIAQAAGESAAAGSIVVAWMDAHRRDVFSAMYRVADAPAFSPERLTAVDGARVESPLALFEEIRAVQAPLLFAGDGAIMYTGDIARQFPSAGIVPLQPLAGAVGRIAAARAQRGETIDPAAIQPLYVRRPDAEVARDSRA